MIRILCTVALGLAIVVGGSSISLGQMGMGRGGTSAFGGFGQSAFSQGGFGQSGFGNAGFGASRFGRGGGFGNAGFGASQFGGGGFGSSGLGGGFGGGGFGNQAFGMGGMGGAPMFVGRDAADMQAMFQQMGRAAMQPSIQATRTTTRSRRDAQPAAAQNPPQTLRVELQVAFDAPRPAADAVATRLRTRLGKILSEHNMSQPAVTMIGDVVVLRGEAASESERLVLERLIAMEPGVRAVQNEMTVATVPSADTLPITGR